MTETVIPVTEAAPAPAEAQRSPFKGLMPYTEADAAFFFGRGRERELIASNILAARLTLLYGASGVGKSSVLLAGACADLAVRAEESLADEDSPGFVTVVVRAWRDDALETVAAATRAAVVALVGGTDLPQPPPGATLAEVLDHWSTQVGGKLLLVFDQFEEYFLYHEAERGPGTFDEEFPRAVNRAGLRANFLISIREDALARLDRFKGRIPNLFDNRLQIEHLKLDAARDAMRKPIDEYNRRVAADDRMGIEDELVELVLGQVRPGQLTLGTVGAGTTDASVGDEPRVETPFLQIVLTALWEEETARGSRMLRASTLHDLGGAEKIARDRLEARMSLLTPAEQDIAAAVFHFLVTRSGTKIAHTAADLAEFAELQTENVEPALEKLASGDARILRPIAPPHGEGASRYEIFHDVLGPAVLEWRAQHLEAERRMAAEAAAERARRRARLSYAIAAASGLFALGVGVLAWWAVDQRESAKAQRYVALATAALATDPQESLVLAQKALAIKGSEGAESAFRVAASQSRLRLADVHGSSVLSTSFSHDGRWLLSAGRGTVTVIDASTGRRVGSSYETGTGISEATFGNSSRLVAIAGWNGSAAVWDPAGKRPTTVCRASSTGLASAELVPGDKRIVTLDWDGVLRVFPLDACTATGRPSATLVQRGVGYAAIATASPLVAAGNSRGDWIRLFDTKTGRLERTIASRESGGRGLQFSRDGRLLLAIGDVTARVWNVRTGEEVGRPVTETGQIEAADFSAGGREAATASSDVGHVWRVGDGKQIAELTGHLGRVNYMAFRPDGKAVVTASSDGTARVWDVASGGTLFELRGNRGVVNEAAFSPNGLLVATASDDGVTRIWDASRGHQLDTVGGGTRSAVFTPDGSRVVVVGENGRVHRIDLATGASGDDLDPRSADLVERVALSRDGRLLATGNENGSADIRDASTGALRRRFTVSRLGYAVRAVAFNGTGKLLVTGSDDWTAAVWNTSTGARVARLVYPTDPFKSYSHGGPVDAAAFSPDGRLVVTGGQDRLVRVWSLRTHRQLWTLHGHRGNVTSIAFDPKNKNLLATASTDQTARVWNVRSRREIADLDAHLEPLTAVAFSPDERFIATAGEDGTVRIWRWDDGKKTKKGVRSGILLAAIKVAAGALDSISYSSDGKWLLAASEDGTVTLVTCATCGHLSALEAQVAARQARLPKSLTHVG